MDASKLFISCHLACFFTGSLLLSSTVLDQLSFDQRLNIALGTAQGLEYLHNSARIKISHGNVKSENVFIDENYQVRKLLFFLKCG